MGLLYYTGSVCLFFSQLFSILNLRFLYESTQVFIAFPNYQTVAYRVNNHHRTIICPSSQLHAAVLLIKWEVRDYNFTVTFKNGRRCPGDLPCVFQKDFGVFNNGKITICTVKGRMLAATQWPGSSLAA